MSTYFDFAAATPLDEEVLAAMVPYFSDRFYNPSAIYGAARDVAGDMQAARQLVAEQLGARPAEIIFTAGGTESDNLAIDGVMRTFRDAELLVSSIEHDAVMKAAERHDARIIPVPPNGIVEPDRLAGMITDKTVLVSVMYANNEIGTIQPLGEISRLLSEVRLERKSRGISLPIYLHSDACQAANYLDIHISRLGVDLLTLNGGKIYGPKQSGVLYVKGSLLLEPQIVGGGQERGLRSGTENVPAIIGFARALQLAQSQRQSEIMRLQTLQKQLIDQLTKRLPEVRINGSLKKRLPNNVHATFPGADNERLLIRLDEAGIQAAAGSACSASSDEPSHVLKAIGLSEAEARASLRFTMGRQTTPEAVAQLVETLCSIV